MSRLVHRLVAAFGLASLLPVGLIAHGLDFMGEVTVRGRAQRVRVYGLAPRGANPGAGPAVPASAGSVSPL